MHDPISTIHGPKVEMQRLVPIKNVQNEAQNQPTLETKNGPIAFKNRYRILPKKHALKARRAPGALLGASWNPTWYVWVPKGSWKPEFQNFGRFSGPKLGFKIYIFATKKRSKIVFASKYDSEALRDRFWTSKWVALRSIFGRMLMLKCATPKPAKMAPLPHENLIFHNLSC